MSRLPLHSVAFRLVLVTVLICAQVGLFLHRGQQQMDQTEHDDLVTEYDAHVDEKLRIGGIVVSTSPPTVAIDYGADKTLKIQLYDFDRRVSKGARVSVYGTLKRGYAIQTEEAVVHSETNRIYMYATSFLAILLVTVLWFRA